MDGTHRLHDLRGLRESHGWRRHHGIHGLHGLHCLVHGLDCLVHGLDCLNWLDCLVDRLYRLVHGLHCLDGLYCLVDWLYRLVNWLGCLDGLQGLDDGHQRRGLLRMHGDRYGDGSGGIAEVVRMIWNIGGGHGVQGASHKIDTLATRRGRGDWVDIHWGVGIRTDVTR